jgi:putative ATP-binding cassette transporter
MRSVLQFKIIDFLERETHGVDRKLFVMTAASGTANALILAVINSAVATLGQGGPLWRQLLLFTLALALFAYALRYVMAESSRLAEAAIRNVRVRLADKIRRSDLQALEAIGETDIHARISRETSSIAQAAGPLFSAAQSALMLAFTLLYITFVSPMAALLVVGLIVVAVGIYLKDRQRFEDGMVAASRREDDLFEALNGLLKGFKELRINQLKSDDVFADLGLAATRVRDTRTGLMQDFAKNVVFVQCFFLILVASMVFVLPALAPSFAGSVIKVVAAVLFLSGPLGNVVMMIPVFSQVNVTLDHLARLEATLDAGLTDGVVGVAPAGALRDFQSIRFEGVGFSYHAPDGSCSFQVGPIDLEVRRGEILFLVGGNGSGKTTLLKLFTALYPPMAGCLRVDGAEIGPLNLQAYRELFSAIFSDFHLFDKLHGLRAVVPERVDELLRQMDLASKTALVDGRFSNLQLSTGQRKRLALVVSYLEDKQVYVFDEVAADQDPHFRRYFYENLLPELKRDGKTVVVVSHDDRYFQFGDRVLTMDYGNLVEMTPTKHVQTPAKPRKRRAGSTEPRNEGPQT